MKKKNLTNQNPPLEDFETFQEKMNLATERLERQMQESKPWYMRGEILANDRDENAVLEEHLEVQRHGTFKPQPADEDEITAFIRKAIKEQAFDNPQFKSKEQLTVKTGNSELVQTLTQKSLVEDYENLFAKRNVLEKEQENPVKNAIQKEILELFEKLDALSNLHFVPHKHLPEAIVIQNKSALALEEAGPTSMAFADVLAPEEVCAPRGEICKGSSELTQTDKRRHRRKLMRIRSKRNRISSKPITDKQAALDKVIRMAHRPGSNVKLIS